MINISLQGSHEANKEQAVEGQRIDREASQRNSHEQTNHVRLTDDEIIDDSTEQGHSRQVDVDEMGREPPVPQPATTYGEINQMVVYHVASFRVC